MMTSTGPARRLAPVGRCPALVLAAALAACTEGEDAGDSGSLLERADEREATQEAGSSGSQSLFGRATP